MNWISALKKIFSARKAQKMTSSLLIAQYTFHRILDRIADISRIAGHGAAPGAAYQGICREVADLCTVANVANFLANSCHDLNPFRFGFSVASCAHDSPFQVRMIRKRLLKRLIEQQLKSRKARASGSVTILTVNISLMYFILRK